MFRSFRMSSKSRERLLKVLAAARLNVMVSHSLPFKSGWYKATYIAYLKKHINTFHVCADWSPLEHAPINYLLIVGGEGDEMCSHLHQSIKKFTKFVRVNIQMKFHWGDCRRDRACFSLSGYEQPVWIRIELSNSEIASFSCCTSV